jgi:copper transport protein
VVSRGIGVLLLVVLALGGLPAVASAHAQLEATSPQRGAVLRAVPGQVVFRFDEPVEGSFGAVRVFDRAGRRVDAGDAFHPGGVGKALGVHLRGGIAQGSYTATYRVVSADGHIVSGGFVFSVGRASGSRLTVAQLTASGGGGAVGDAVFGLARGLQYTAIALALGALAFLLLVWRGVLREPAATTPAGTSSGAFVRRTRRLVLVAAGVGAVSAAAAVVMEGAQAAGIGGFDVLRVSIVRETLHTRFGTMWGLAVLAWLALGALAAWSLRAREREPLPAAGAFAALVVPAGFLLVLPALGGHAGSQSPSGMLVPTNVAHVAGMCAWVGGIATLLLALPAATRQLDPPDRGRLLAAVLARFRRWRSRASSRSSPRGWCRATSTSALLCTCSTPRSAARSSSSSCCCWR